MSERAITPVKTEETRRTMHRRKTEDPRAIRSPSDHILSLQRTIGNHAVERFIHGLSGGAKEADESHKAQQGGDSATTGRVPTSEPETANEPQPQAAPGQASPNSWRASSELWYFNEEPHQEPLATQTTLQADAKSAGTFLWSVTEGNDKAELEGARGGAHAVKTDDNRMKIKSKGGSQGADDVKVRVSRLAPDGTPSGTYEGALGVRTPAGTRKVSESTTHYQPSSHAPSNWPVADEEGGGGAGGETTPPTKEEETGTGMAGGGPSAVPNSLTAKGSTHAADATWGYESRINYEVLDDKGKAIKGFDVNEQWSSGVVDDEPKHDWRRGAAGGTTATGTTFFDKIQGEGAAHKPTPQSPQSPLGTKAIYHWGQEWYIGSTTPGKGTKVQTNTLQKYQDHAEHQNIKSPP